MSIGNNTQIGREMSELLGDEVVLKLHDGHPGADCTENLVDGTGRPAVYRRTDTAPTEFRATHKADVRDYYVSIWRDGLAISLLGSNARPGVYSYKLAPGDPIVISSFPRITVSPS